MKRTFTPRKSKKVLIVSDDLASATLYQERLENEKNQAEIAADGQRALRIIEIDPVDLVIVDLSKWGIHGMETIRSIRAHPHGKTVPIISLSDHYFGRHLEAAEEAGANRCITKTECTPAQLAGIVRATFLRGSLAPVLLSPDAPALSIEVAAVPPPAEAEFEAKVRRAFLNETPGIIARLRRGHRTFVQSGTETQRAAELSEMHRQAGVLASSAGLAGLRKIAQLASALEALLVRLNEEPIPTSKMRTVAQSLDVLAALFAKAATNEPEIAAPPAILVIERETDSANSINDALARTGLIPTTLNDPASAAERAAHDPFDLILIDLEFPGLDGLSLCTRIRKEPANRLTPVILVTAQIDLPHRARCTFSGGSDLIAKPFDSAELAVKALTWLFRDARSSGVFEKKTAVEKRTPDQSRATISVIGDTSSSPENFPAPLRRAC
jgi:CheY-like chemotaxis protein